VDKFAIRHLLFLVLRYLNYVFFFLLLLHLDNVILVSSLDMNYAILYLNSAILIIVIVEQFL
jgi:hypothetical protein